MSLLNVILWGANTEKQRKKNNPLPQLVFYSRSVLGVHTHTTCPSLSLSLSLCLRLSSVPLSLSLFKFSFGNDLSHTAQRTFF